MKGIILDLQAYEEETADIRMADGQVLHLKKPSEALIIELLRLQHIDTAKPEEIVAALNRVCRAVLNNNTDGDAFSEESVNGLSYDAKTAIITAYTAFATELQSRPTAPSPSSPETRKTREAETSRSRGRFRPWRRGRG